jgi:hypothetical protein
MDKRMSTPSSTNNKTLSNLSYPETSIVGSIGNLARLLASGTEVPVEFYFAAGLAVVGWLCSSNLRLKIGLDIDPRLYVVLLGESYEVKKSTAQSRMIKFFDPIINDLKLKHHVAYGVGSAEGLMRQLHDYPDLLLAYDELKSLVDKCGVRNSTLMPMVTSLFEGENWDNLTAKSGQSVRNVRLSLLGCCTTQTYAGIWTNDAIAIGLPNRLFVVSADRKEKVAWPTAPDAKAFDIVRQSIKKQIESLHQKQLELDITLEARDAWAKWYEELPSSEHVKRLDTIGFRLLALIAFTTDKKEVDLECVNWVTSILDYELNLRQLTDPINADNTIAKLEEAIRRTLRTVGPMRKRELRLKVHADRYGIWAFDRALANLKQVSDIAGDGNSKAYDLVKTVG